MSEHTATQSRQTAAPEAGSKNELRLERQCACGQHNLGGGECRDCEKKRVKLQRWSTDRPPPEALLAHRRPTPDMPYLEGASQGLDFSRIRVRAGPAAARLPADTRWIPKPSASAAPGDRRMSMPRNGTAELMPDDARSSRLSSGERVIVPVASTAIHSRGITTPEPAEPASTGGREGAAPHSAGPPAEAPASATAPVTPTSATPPPRPAARRAHAAGAVDTRPELGSSLEDEALEEDAEELLPGAQRFFLYDGGRAGPAATQMSKDVFLARLRGAVTRAAEDALADTSYTTDGCPYLRFWFDYYSRKSSRHIERALRRYAPEATRATRATDYIPIVVERVRSAVTTWAETGEITGVPRDLLARPPDGQQFSRPAVSERTRQGFGRVFFKARAGGARAADDPEAIQAALGDGRPLDSGVRARMEAVFGRGLGPVHLHTGATPNRFAGELNARAFTVGDHVAFGAGQYRPGTPVGDALIAHEIAHVVQQQGAGQTAAPMAAGSTPYEALERDADRAATGAMASLWGTARNAMLPGTGPRLRSRLQLSRCGIKCPTKVEVAQLHPVALTADHVNAGWRTGWGAVAEMKVSDAKGTSFNGTAIHENLNPGTNTCRNVDNCTNTSGMGGASGATFEVGSALGPASTGAKYSCGPPLLIPSLVFPAKKNTFYDCHLIGYGSSKLHTQGLATCEQDCSQYYDCNGSQIADSDFRIRREFTPGVLDGVGVTNITLSKS